MYIEVMWFMVLIFIVNDFVGGWDCLVDVFWGIGHVLYMVVSLCMMCICWDIGLSVDEPEDGGPRFYFYDNILGGVGFVMWLYKFVVLLLVGVWELIVSCPCIGGCFSCIGVIWEMNVDV